MKRVLITGATGNVGSEVIKSLRHYDTNLSVIAACRNLKACEQKFQNLKTLKYRLFNFEDHNSFTDALKDIDILFLLRPPHIADVDTHFKPLLIAARKADIKNIVFLSVQGAEKSKVIPHNKIEQLIKSFNFNYIFIRPSYFMQNLNTALLYEIRDTRTITLPSGNAKFNWIDTKDIGKVSAVLINAFQKYKNTAYDITGSENFSFNEVTKIMSKLYSSEYKFQSINPIKFFLKKKNEGHKSDFALVMTLLHFLPRLQKEPKITDSYFELTGQPPSSLKDYLIENKTTFLD